MARAAFAAQFDRHTLMTTNFVMNRSAPTQVGRGPKRSGSATHAQHGSTLGSRRKRVGNAVRSVGAATRIFTKASRPTTADMDPSNRVERPTGKVVARHAGLKERPKLERRPTRTRRYRVHRCQDTIEVCRLADGDIYNRSRRRASLSATTRPIAPRSSSGVQGLCNTTASSRANAKTSGDSGKAPVQ